MTELATQQTAVTTPSGSWGAEGASSKDLVLPRLNLMQDLSKLVKDGKAKAGDIVNIATSSVVAGDNKKVDIIPILTFSEWLLYDVETDTRTGRTKDRYAGKVMCDKTNENWPQEAVENGKPIRRIRQINVLCLLPNDVEGLPCMVSFRKTGMMAGKKLSTHFQVSSMKNLPAARTVYGLLSTSETREGNTYYKFEVEPGRAATEEELKAAYYWYQLFNQGAAKVAEEQDESAPF